MKKYDIVAIGDANIDITLKVDHLPTHDDKVLGVKIAEQIGGTVANCSCVCGSLGLKVTSSSRNGFDLDAKKITDEFSKYNIDLSYVDYIQDFEANKAYIMLDASGEKSLIYVPTPNNSYSDDLLEKAIAQSAYIYTMPGNKEKFAKIAHFAQKHQTKIIVDIETTIIENREDLDNILHWVDIAIFNHNGFLKAIKEDPTEKTLTPLFKEFNLDSIVVTMGSKGVCAFDGQFAYREGFSVPVVDTTGAGDTFNAAFIYGVIQNYPLQKSLLFASAAAAISIGGVGPKGIMPTKSLIHNFLKERGLSC